MSEVSEVTGNCDIPPRNAEGLKKLEDPKYHQKMDWINALEKDYPGVPFYFLDLITSFVQANPEEADKIMNGEKTFDGTKLDEWRNLVKTEDAKGSCPLTTQEFINDVE